MTELTKEEVNDIFHGVELNFEGYYKYFFSYSGTKDEYSIGVDYGGNADDIYRSSFGPKETLDIVDYCYSVVVTKNGEKVFEYMEW